MTEKTNKVRRALVLSLVAVVITGAGYSFYQYSNNHPKNVANNSKLFELKIAQTGDFLLYSGLYLAVDTGAFEKNGLKVSISNTGGDDKSVAAVLAGQADIGVGDPTFAGLAKERGQDIRVIASVVNGAPFWGITYSPEVESKYKATGLKGLKVATFPAPSTAYSLQKDMFTDAKLEPNIVEGAFGSLGGILETGHADIALELEPNVSLFQAQKGAKVLYSMSELHPDFAITGATVKGSFISEHPVQVKAFCNSLNQAYNFARQNSAEATSLLAKRFPELPVSVVEAALGRMTSSNIIPTNVHVSDTGWEKAISLRVEVGDVKNAVLAKSALDNKSCSM